jgi:hypothetical protein
MVLAATAISAGKVECPRLPQNSGELDDVGLRDNAARGDTLYVCGGDPHDISDCAKDLRETHRKRAEAEKI